MEDELILFENVHYMYPNGTWALRGVNLKISRGERVAIVGSNGAGKTTLLKHLNGLLKPTRGRVVVFGVDTRERSVAELSKTVGIVFQNPTHMFFSETVRDEIAFALKNLGYPPDAIDRRVDLMLKMFELEEYADQSPFALSGGEMRRLAIASVLSYDPEVVVFDEPTVGQDRFQKEKLAEILRMLGLQGKTVIVVTHDIEFVAENFSRVVVLHGGRVVGDGAAPEILYNSEILSEAGLVMPVIARLSKRLGIVDDRTRPLTPYDLVRALERMVGR